MRALHFAGLAGCLLLTDCAPPRLLFSEQRAARAYQTARIPVALRRYKRLVQEVPRNALFWARLGNCEALLHDARGAAHAYTQALAIRPKLVMVRYNLARIRLQQAYAVLTPLGTTPGPEALLEARARRLRLGVSELLKPRVGPLRAPAMATRRHSSKTTTGTTLEK